MPETRRSPLPSEYQDRFTRISHYIDEAQRDTIESLIILRSLECVFLIKSLCKNVKFINGVPIISYRTVGKRIREVTVEDVNNDIEKMRSLGQTKAAQIEHLELARTLSFCLDVHEEGYRWDYKAMKK